MAAQQDNAFDLLALLADDREAVSMDKPANGDFRRYAVFTVYCDGSRSRIGGGSWDRAVALGNENYVDGDGDSFELVCQVTGETFSSH